MLGILSRNAQTFPSWNPPFPIPPITGPLLRPVQWGSLYIHLKKGLALPYQLEDMLRRSVPIDYRRFRAPETIEHFATSCNRADRTFHSVPCESSNGLIALLHILGTSYVRDWPKPLSIREIQHRQDQPNSLSNTASQSLLREKEC